MIKMQTEEKKYTTKVSDSFDQTDEKCIYEVPFRRWLIKEIEEGRLTIVQAIERFNFHPVSGHNLIYKWRVKYSPEMVLALPLMTEKEKKEVLAMQQRMKQLEDELEEASMRNIALNMLIDVAEDKLKINIRKKPGAKQ